MERRILNNYHYKCILDFSSLLEKFMNTFLEFFIFQQNSIDNEGLNVRRIKLLGHYAPYIYDTIWAIALAVRSFQEENVTRTENEMKTADKILSKFQQLQFQGLTVRMTTFHLKQKWFLSFFAF